VDRKKQHTLYKDILKEYATYSLEIGYHNLFFPGGTRARSGAVEQKLKLGLLGTGLDAYIRKLQAGDPRPNVYVVPCTVNYPLVLEAETLIDDYLKESGKAQYIITDDEFPKPRRVWRFMKEVVQLDSRITIEFGSPLDVYGNRVNDSGQSVDHRGRVIDTSRYVLVDGKPAPDIDRDNQYTRELGVAVARAFRQHNVLASTHVAAFTVFQMLRKRNAGLDLYRLLRTGGEDEGIPIGEVVEQLERLMANLREREANGQVKLVPLLKSESARDILADALRLFGTYHTQAALERAGDRIFSKDMNLLLYYHNRLSGYGAEALIKAPGTRRAA
jgi:glycerol-3-phosphate O-acyltransferase